MSVRRNKSGTPVYRARRADTARGRQSGWTRRGKRDRRATVPPGCHRTAAAGEERGRGRAARGLIVLEAREGRGAIDEEQLGTVTAETARRIGQIPRRPGPGHRAEPAGRLCRHRSPSRCRRWTGGTRSAGSRSRSPSRARLAVASRLICRDGVPLTCGPSLAGGIVIGHGLSFEVSDFWVRGPSGPAADAGECGLVAVDPSADRVVAEEVAADRGCLIRRCCGSGGAAAVLGWRP